MKTQIKMWGHSLGLRIPKSFAIEADIEKNSLVNIEFKNGKLIISPHRKKKLHLSELLSHVKPSHLHDETDFGNPMGKEVW